VDANCTVSEVVASGGQQLVASQRRSSIVSVGLTRAPRALRLAAIGVPLAAIVVALFLAFASDRREIARVGTNGATQVLTVDCGLRGGPSQDDWGEAATRRCEPVQTSHLLRAGLVAVAGGVVGGVIAVVVRRRGGGARGQHLLVGVAVGLGLPTLVFGGLLDVSGSTVTRLATDQPELPDDAQILELLNVDFTRAGPRLVEERWIVVDRGIDEVRRTLDDAGWRLADVRREFADGWVRLRTSAGRDDTLEVGTFGAATSVEADIGPNARRLLASVPADPDDIVVHVEPALARTVLGAGA
jgi:hypothetical protein